MSATSKRAATCDEIAQRLRQQGIKNGWSADVPWSALDAHRQEAWRKIVDIAFAAFSEDN